jgi:hypothetical protein
MANGKWQMENGKWKMENGKWKMENGIGSLDLGFRLWVSGDQTLLGRDLCIHFLGKIITGIG